MSVLDGIGKMADVTHHITSIVRFKCFINGGTVNFLAMRLYELKLEYVEAMMLDKYTF